MTCQHCQSAIPDTAKVCPYCGTAVYVAPPAPPAPPVQPEPPSYQPPHTFSVEDLPDEYRPMSAWAYAGFSLLFSVPFIGWIFAIVFSFAGGNVHRRSFARSYWCLLLIGVALAVIFYIIAFAIAGSAVGVLGGLLDEVASSSYYY